MQQFNLQGTIQEITVTRYNAKIKLTVKNSRNINSKKQYKKILHTVTGNNTKIQLTGTMQTYS